MSEPHPPTVTVSASAEHEVAPDSVQVWVTASGEGATAGDAAAAMRAVYARLEEIVRALPTTVEVTHGTAATHRGWSGGRRREHAAWRSERQLTLETTEVGRAGELAAAVGAVAEAALGGPQWRVDRDNPAHGELQAETVHEARRRAERYAQALGLQLGQLVQLRDPGTDHGAVATFAGGVGGAAPEWDEIDFSPQAQTLHATVEATWYLVPTDGASDTPVGTRSSGASGSARPSDTRTTDTHLARTPSLTRPAQPAVRRAQDAEATARSVESPE